MKLEIWDTAGQERFRSLTASYYRKADAILIIFDLNQKDSFTNIHTWLGEIMEKGEENVVKVLVGNKSDLSYNVQQENIQEFVQQNRISYYEVSAKNGNNIDHLFNRTAEVLLKRFGSTKNRVPKDSIVSTNQGRVTLSSRVVKNTQPESSGSCKC